MGDSTEERIVASAMLRTGSPDRVRAAKAIPAEIHSAGSRRMARMVRKWRGEGACRCPTRSSR
jgi:hypothetical protein